jgi:predicted ATPase
MAIELAAARVEALGVSQLAGLLDGRLELLAGGNRLAAGRHQSLAAAAEWSYQLLAEEEQRLFRRLSVFPAPFTWKPPGWSPARCGADGAATGGVLAAGSTAARPRWAVPVRDAGDAAWLRGWLLAEAGEQDRAQLALVRYALGVAEQAGASLRASTGEAAAARRLDAEDTTMTYVLGWSSSMTWMRHCG